MPGKLRRSLNVSSPVSNVPHKDSCYAALRRWSMVLTAAKHTAETKITDYFLVVRECFGIYNELDHSPLRMLPVATTDIHSVARP
jgi:hypothetical protein